MRPRRGAALAGGAAWAALAACQPLPHPFADDRPPAALMVVPDSIDIAVSPFEGEPRATAAKLNAAIASELLNHNITATAQTASHTSYTLDGRIDETPPRDGQATVTLSWRLHDANGQLVNEYSTRVTAPARAWAEGADEQVAQLAAASAGMLASLVTDVKPKEEPAAGVSGRVRVAVRKVAGAPGDGDASLATSMAAVLHHADIDIVDAKTGQPDLAVDGEVSAEPKGNQQHVKIVWRVSRANGNEIGTVVQENDVPRGRLDGPWGDIAYNVAIAAGSGIMQLVERGAPPVKLGAATPPAPPSPALPSPPSGPLARSPGPAPGPPAPGNLESPAVVLPPVNVGPAEPETPVNAPVVLPRRGVPLPPQ